jgi:hypothetical protein
MAERLGEKATGVMISVNQLRKRRSDFVVGDGIWLNGKAFLSIGLKVSNYALILPEQVRKKPKYPNVNIDDRL